jgi:hypothetical protein
MSRTRKAQRKARQRNSAIGWSLLLFVVIVGLAAAAWFMFRALPEQLAAQNCPSTRPVAMTAIVIDATDELDNVARDHLRLRLETFLKESVRVGEGVQIWRVSGDREPGRADTLVICRPPVSTSWVASNPQRQERRHQEAYVQPLVQAIGEALATTPGKTSPILETLQDVQISFGSASKKRIVLASDLVQHTTFSLAFGNRDFTEFRRSPAYVSLAPGDLTEVEVLVLQLARRKQFGQESGLQAFWRALIEENHGTFTVQPVMGQS